MERKLETRQVYLNDRQIKFLINGLERNDFVMVDDNDIPVVEQERAYQDMKKKLLALFEKGRKMPYRKLYRARKKKNKHIFAQYKETLKRLELFGAVPLLDGDVLRRLFVVSAAAFILNLGDDTLPFYSMKEKWDKIDKKCEKFSKEIVRFIEGPDKIKTDADHKTVKG